MDHHRLPDIEEEFINLLNDQGIENDLIKQLYSAYLPIAEWIANQPQPFVVGINGAQGSGKSTLSQILELLLRQRYQLNVASLSIDDLYMSQSDRQQMAEAIHPLFATRGVPGTHDVTLGCETIKSLQTDETTAIPRFNKASDNPLPQSKWPIFEGRADVVIFEGWCVGATAQCEDELVHPINPLEEIEDNDGKWRSHVNRQLQDHYPALFELIDALIMLQIPEYKKVLEWRTLQESKLSMQNKCMTSEELARFVMHFERLTRFMMHKIPPQADILLSLNHQHQIHRVDIRDKADIDAANRA